VVKPVIPLKPVPKPATVSKKPIVQKKLPEANKPKAVPIKPKVTPIKPKVVPAKPKPIAKKLTVVAKPPVSNPPVAPATADTFDFTGALDSLSRFSDPQFDAFDWGSDRRFPSAVYLPIDAKIQALMAILEKERALLQSRLSRLIREIDARIAVSLSKREIRILQYIKTEFTILGELYRRPH
jgi:hypothetical protein